MFEQTGRFGTHLMQQVGDVVPVLPVALVSTVMLEAGSGGLGELEIKAKAYELQENLKRNGAHLYIPRGDQDYAITTGLRMLKLRNLVDESAGTFTIAPDQHVILAYYANSIAHLRR